MRRAVFVSTEATWRFGILPNIRGLTWHGARADLLRCFEEAFHRPFVSGIAWMFEDRFMHA